MTAFTVLFSHILFYVTLGDKFVLLSAKFYFYLSSTSFIFLSLSKELRNPFFFFRVIDDYVLCATGIDAIGTIATGGEGGTNDILQYNLFTKFIIFTEIC